MRWVPFVALVRPRLAASDRKRVPSLSAFSSGLQTCSSSLSHACRILLSSVGVHWGLSRLRRHYQRREMAHTPLAESVAEILRKKSQPPTCGIIWVSKPILSQKGGWYAYCTINPACRHPRSARRAAAGAVSDRLLPWADPGVGRHGAHAARPHPLHRSPACPARPIV